MKRLLLLLFSLLTLCASALAAQPTRYHLVGNLSLPNDMLLAQEKTPGAAKRCASALSAKTPAPITFWSMTICTGLTPTISTIYSR
ncbi:hypothetical protein GGER_13550 [Serratia rubidaea]